MEAARANGYVAIDTETDSLSASTAKLVGVSLAIAPGKACYIPVNHIDPDSAPSDGGFSFAAKPAPRQIPLPTIIELLKPLLADSATLKILLVSWKYPKLR